MVKPKALEAYEGKGEFKPGEHCRFCRGKARCRARMNAASALHDFAQVVNVPPKATPDRRPITNAEVAWALGMAEDIKRWCEDLKDYAKQAILNGETIPGYKVVAGKSDRAFADPDGVPEILMAMGYSESEIYKPREMLTLTGIEKLVGKKRFADAFDGCIVKPMGKPALAP